MKKLLYLLAIVFISACGNQSAENKPTDQDQTKNNDTSVVPADSSTIIKRDSTDTTRL